MATQIDDATEDAVMSDGSDGADAADPGLQRRSRRNLALGLSALGIVVLGLIGWGAYSVTAQSAVNGISVVYDAQPLRCDGAEVGVVPDPSNIEFLQPVVSLTEGMTCELRVQVLNNGWSEVAVTDVTALGMGTGNVLGLEAQFVNPNGQTWRDAPEENAAVFEIDGGIVVPVGESSTFTIVFGYGGGASMLACGAQGWNPPRVTVSALGATRDVQPGDENTVWAREGTAAECAE